MLVSLLCNIAGSWSRGPDWARRVRVRFAADLDPFSVASFSIVLATVVLLATFGQSAGKRPFRGSDARRNSTRRSRMLRNLGYDSTLPLSPR